MNLKCPLLFYERPPLPKPLPKSLVVVRYRQSRLRRRWPLPSSTGLHDLPYSDSRLYWLTIVTFLSFFTLYTPSPKISPSRMGYRGGGAIHFRCSKSCNSSLSDFACMRACARAWKEEEGGAGTEKEGRGHVKD